MQAAADSSARTPPLRAHREALEELFTEALEGRLPRDRELKAHEPARLNETHLAMLTMRAGGFRQNIIAQAFGVTDANVSIVCNHPDGKTVIARLRAMKSQDPTAIETRLAALTEPFVEALENVAFDPEVPDIKKASLGFRVLAMNGYGAARKVEGKISHEHRFPQLDASREQIGDLALALRESREIDEVDAVDVTEHSEAAKLLGEGRPPQGGEPPSGGVAAPSSDDPPPPAAV